ncbi:MAG: response regulator [Planctomycetaceae bacterium]|nr:response regulator [Planctomycetaceae bacterium]
MFVILFLCLNIPFIGVWITVKHVSEKGYYEQKKIFLKSLARVLDSHLGEGGYDEILKEGEAQSASREEQIAVLNKALADDTDRVASAAEGIGAGFYARDLDAIVTYGPASKFGEKVGVAIAPEHQGRLVMADGIERLAQGTMVRGNILNMMHPVKRNEKVIGYIWVNEATTDIEKGLRKVSRSIMIFVGIFYVLMTVCVGLIFRRTIAVERKALTAAESANSTQKNFLAQMSHEIRTPLNGIIGISDLLSRTELSEKQKEYFSLLHTSANHLLTLINDILDFSKIEAGKLELEHIEFDLVSTVETVVKIVRPKTMEKNIELQSVYPDTFPHIVFGDPMRLRQILVNLLNNAIKFTEKGGVRLEVSIRESAAHTSSANAGSASGVATSKTPAGSVPSANVAPVNTASGSAAPADIVFIHFAVIDTGIGIPAEQQNRLFTQFLQVNASQARKFGGTGLGLAISKQLVQMMGGTIGVQSVENAGSTFYFTIPFQISYHQDSSVSDSILAALIPSATDDHIISDGIILIAEDNQINQIVVGEVLTQAGFKFDIVSNGRLAYEAFVKKEYALILMDCQMPEMDGYEAARLIRKVEKDRETEMQDEYGANPIPIIALTANATKEDEKQCLDAGMNDYCVKPITPTQLIQVMRKWMQKGKTQ